MKVLRVIHDGEVMLSALIIACSFTELSWGWFWIGMVLSSLQVYGWGISERTNT